MNPNYGYPERKDFLIQMYNQLCSEINRHINVIWQIVGVLLSTFAIYALVEKSVIPLDIATAILILVCSLNVGIVIESNYWYNRNLVIIANIERQFLLESDLKDIHWYFANHRKNNAYLDMMLIQIIFIVLLASIIIFYHFSQRVLPGIHEPSKDFEFIRSIPYLISIICCLCLFLFHKKRISNYNDFVKNAPGILIQSADDFPGNSDHQTK